MTTASKHESTLIKSEGGYTCALAKMLLKVYGKSFQLIKL